MLLNIPLKIIKKENKANRQTYKKYSLRFFQGIPSLLQVFPINSCIFQHLQIFLAACNIAMEEVNLNFSRAIQSKSQNLTSLEVKCYLFWKENNIFSYLYFFFYVLCYIHSVLASVNETWIDPFTPTCKYPIEK